MDTLKRPRPQNLAPVSANVLLRMTFRLISTDDEWEQLLALYDQHVQGHNVVKPSRTASGTWLGAFTLQGVLKSALWFAVDSDDSIEFCLVWNRGRLETIASMRLMVSFTQMYAAKRMWFISLSEPDQRALMTFHRAGFYKTAELDDGLARYEREAQSV